MKKINIALRRTEVSGQNHSRGISRVPSGQPAISFHSRDELVSRFLDMSGNPALCPSEPGRDNFIEVDLNRSQIDYLDESLESDNIREVAGTFHRGGEGVLLLNLEFAGKKVSRYLSAKSLAQMLEMSPRTIYRLHKMNSLPGIRIGRNLRFRFEDVLDFLDARLEKGEG